MNRHCFSVTAGKRDSVDFNSMYSLQEGALEVVCLFPPLTGEEQMSGKVEIKTLCLVGGCENRKEGAGVGTFSNT